jgi:nucleotide-binding universal stress UspA family protein
LVDRGLKKITRVLVAYAGGHADLAALELARRMGRTAGISLTLFHVVAPGDAQRAGKGRSQIAATLQGLAEAPRRAGGAERAELDQLFAEPDASSGSVQVRVVEHTSPPDAVLQECGRGYDLVVLGVHARWGLGAGMISLRRRRVLSEASVSILAVHPPGAAVPNALPK